MNVIIPGAPEPLAWYIAGPLLGLFVPLLLLLTGKDLGISSSFRHLCSLVLPKSAKVKIKYLNYDWKTGLWQLVFVLGIALGGWISVQALGTSGLIFTPASSFTPWGLVGLFAGGVLVGFGTRWADGCTSGHTIAGISQLKLPSVVASVCFVAGGAGASLVHRLFLGGTVL